MTEQNRKFSEKDNLDTTGDDSMDEMNTLDAAVGLVTVPTSSSMTAMSFPAVSAPMPKLVCPMGPPVLCQTRDRMATHGGNVHYGDQRWFVLNCRFCFNNRGMSGYCNWPCPKTWLGCEKPVAVATTWPDIFQDQPEPTQVDTVLLTFRSDGEAKFGKMAYSRDNFLKVITGYEFLKLKMRVAMEIDGEREPVSDRVWMEKLGSLKEQILVQESWVSDLKVINEYVRRVYKNRI